MSDTLRNAKRGVDHWIRSGTMGGAVSTRDKVTMQVCIVWLPTKHVCWQKVDHEKTLKVMKFI